MVYSLFFSPCHQTPRPPEPPGPFRQGKRRLCFRLFDSNQDGFAEKADGDGDGQVDGQWFVV